MEQYLIKPVDHWFCTNCGSVIHDTEYDLASLNVVCVCQKKKLIDFVPHIRREIDPIEREYL